MDRRIFFYSFLVTFFINAFLTLFFLFPAALQQQAMPLSLIGWLMGVASIGSLLSRPLGSYMTERVGIKRSLLILCLALAAISLPLIWERTFLSLFFIRAALGSLLGMAAVALMAYQALIVPVKQRGSIYAWIGIAYVAPQLTVIPPAEFFITNGRLDLYLGMAPLFALLTFIFVFTLPNVPSPAGRDAPPAAAKGAAWGKWGDLLAVPGFWPFLLAAFTFAMINATTLQYIPAFMINKGLAASIFLATNAGTALILRIFAYRLMDRLNRPRAIGLIVAGMGMALFLLRWADSHTAFAFGGFLYGTFMGIGFPIILALTPDIFPPHLIPKGVSIGMLAMDAGFILAPVLAGYLGQSFGLGVVFTIIGVGAMLSGFGVYLGIEMEHRGGSLNVDTENSNQ
jgi:MFS family permease